MYIVILDNGIYMICENIVHDGHSRFHLYDSFGCIIRVMSVHLLGLSRES